VLLPPVLPAMPVDECQIVRPTEAADGARTFSFMDDGAFDLTERYDGSWQ
jgi:hypothetical protein